MARMTDSSDLAQYGEQQPSNGKRIMIAEDDPFISRMYQTKLVAAGYEVVVKNNGRDAYEEIRTTKPSLILLDINMPELSGLEVLRTLKAEDFDFTDLPVMILTNSSNAKDRDAAKALGVEYLIKAELTPRDVLDRINAKLGLSAGNA